MCNHLDRNRLSVSGVLHDPACSKLAGGFTEVECNFFLKIVTLNTNNYFEWGSGSTTRLAARRARVVTSIEGSKEWVRHMQKSTLPSNVRLRYVNIGPTRAFSTPVQFNTTLGRHYIRAIDHVPPQDVVLVDGRWRVACAMRARNKLSANGMLLVHDFQRKEYQVLRSAFYIVERAGNLVALRSLNATDNFSTPYERIPLRQ